MQDEVIEAIARGLCRADYDHRDSCSELHWSDFVPYVRVVFPIAMEHAAGIAGAFKDAALKCDYCGDIRNTYASGGCSGEAVFKSSERGKEMLFLHGAYEASRYFEKHICRPKEMEQGETIDAICTAIRAAGQTDAG